MNEKYKRNCPVCSSNTYALFLEEKINPNELTSFSYASRKEPEFMRHKLVSCLNCNCVYALSPPENNELIQAYSEASYDSNNEAIFAAQTYIQELSPFLTHLKDLSCAVDIGAGNGALLPLLKDKGFQKVVGIEPSKEAIVYAPSAIQGMLHEGIFTKELAQELKPTFICSFMTLEHVLNPKELVETAFMALEKGGMLAIVVHNYKAPLNKILGAYSPIIDIEHVQLFCPETLTYLLEQCGFKVQGAVNFKNKYPLEYWFRLTPLPKFAKKWIGSLLNFMSLNNYELSLPVGNLMVVAVKENIN